MINFDELYREQYGHKVKMLTRIMHGNVSDAEDIVSESFVRAIKYQHSYNEDRSSVNTWFNSILFNTMRGLKKELSKNKCEEGKIDSVLDPSKDCYTVLILNQQLGKIKNATHNRVVELFVTYGYTSKEISEIEPNMSQTNVTTIINRFNKGARNE